MGLGMDHGLGRGVEVPGCSFNDIWLEVREYVLVL